MRELEKVQTDLRSGQRWLGVFAAILVAVVAVNLQRNFAVGDRVADGETDIAVIKTTMEFVRDDVSEVKSDVKALRTELRRVAEAVGAAPVDKSETKAALTPQR